ncbi:MAG: PUA domain-containing protein [Nitrososphaeria archaeon]
MKINYLSKKEIKQYSREIMEMTGIYFEPERVLELENAFVLVGDGFMVYDMKNNAFYPFLADKITGQLPQLEVDSGAAEHIKQGANVMRPGITKIDSGLKRGRPALITHNGESLALAISMMDYAEAVSAQKGVVAKNVHRQGDPVWNAVIAFVKKYK